MAGDFQPPAPARFAGNVGTMLAAGLSLFWFAGLSPELRNELKVAFRRVWPGRAQAGDKPNERA
jgi:hypothetical protein